MPRTLTLTRTVSITLNSWPATTGGATSPASFQTLLSVSVPAGTFTVNWTVTLSGTIGGSELNNFMLMSGPPGGPDIAVAQSVNAAAAGTYPQAPVSVTLPAGQQLKVKVWSNAGTAGAVYGATIVQGGGNGTAQTGPASPGEIWRPTQVSVSCSAVVTSGTCQASIYAGAAAAQSAFVDGTFSGDTGDTTDAIGGRVVNPGESVFAVWQGGVPGATATLVVSGTRTVP